MAAAPVHTDSQTETPPRSDNAKAKGEQKDAAKKGGQKDVENEPRTKQADSRSTIIPAAGS